MKEIDQDGLVRAVVAAAGGEAVVARRPQQGLVRQLCEPSAVGKPILSDREHEILSLTAAGRSRREIAEALFLSPATVKANLSAMYAKLGVRDRAAAVARAMRLGVLSADQPTTTRTPHFGTRCKT